MPDSTEDQDPTADRPDDGAEWRRSLEPSAGAYPDTGGRPQGSAGGDGSIDSGADDGPQGPGTNGGSLRSGAGGGKPPAGAGRGSSAAGPGGGAPGASPPHRRRARITRMPVVVTVVAVLVVGVLVGHKGSTSPGPKLRSVIAPSAAPAAALSSSWFCAGATNRPDGEAPGRLVISNVSGRTLTANVTFLASGGKKSKTTLQVGADRQSTVAERVKGGGAWVGATVDLDGGAATVEQLLTSKLGTSTAPCATSGSTSWFFTNGATRINASSIITLLNPYPTAAIANFTFTTNEGVESPGAFQGVVVPPDSLVAIGLGSHLRRRSSIATSVAVSAGRLVAWKTDVVSHPRKGTPYLGTKAGAGPDADPASPVFGVTETLGAPAVSPSWYWPKGTSQAGLHEQYTIYNPGTRTAHLELAVRLAQGSAEPVSIDVGAEQVVSVTSADQTRIPSGSTFSVALSSTNGVGVVAARTVSAQAPSSARGIGEQLGATHPASSWLVGGSTITRTLDEEITVSNPTTKPVTVSAQAVSAGRRQALPQLATQLGAKAQTTWVLGSIRHLRSPAAILVKGSGPVVVGVELIGRHGTGGDALGLGVPLAP